ncbi:type VII secretion system-associated protein [Nocardia paucivorans]|uniref:type VII secretion system-associated protein n=1 Tax=Nocardia paucivorans TaxID=114259 RepID=UPI0002FD3BA3|nr:type VII secretion system-associated protein [Nocardia paucivorans]
MGPTPDAIRQDNWFVLVDPGYPADAPPREAMIGGWVIEEEGKVGPFRPNPYYRPSSPDIPTDPIDTLIRLMVSGEQVAEELVATVRDSVVEIGTDEQERPVIGKSPDGALCVVVVTAEVQKAGLDVENWCPILGSELAEVLPEGLDIMLNPAGAAPFRLLRAGLVDANGR